MFRSSTSESYTEPAPMLPRGLVFCRAQRVGSGPGSQPRTRCPSQPPSAASTAAAPKCQTKTMMLASRAWANCRPKLAIEATARAARARVRRVQWCRSTQHHDDGRCRNDTYDRRHRQAGRMVRPSAPSRSQSCIHPWPTLASHSPSGTTGRRRTLMSKPGTALRKAAIAAVSAVASVAACSIMKRVSLATCTGSTIVSLPHTTAAT